MYMMHQNVKKVLFTLEEIEAKTKEIGQQITEDYQGKQPILLGLLKGSVPFMAELAKYIDVDLTFAFMHVSSYVGTHSGQLHIKQDIEIDVKGKDIIIVEDIIDTGNTLFYVKHMLLDRGANSVKIVTLLDKKECRKLEIKADYVGFEIPNAFVVGFGLDYDELYRNLPYIGILKEEVYS